MVFVDNLVLAGLDFEAHFAHDFPIDLDFAVGDEGVGVAAGANAGEGYESVQANGFLKQALALVVFPLGFVGPLLLALVFALRLGADLLFECAKFIGELGGLVA
jgi:hypothetical protein